MIQKLSYRIILSHHQKWVNALVSGNCPLFVQRVGCATFFFSMLTFDLLVMISLPWCQLLEGLGTGDNMWTAGEMTGMGSLALSQ